MPIRHAKGFRESIHLFYFAAVLLTPAQLFQATSLFPNSSVFIDLKLLLFKQYLGPPKHQLTGTTMKFLI